MIKGYISQIGRFDLSTMKYMQIDADRAHLYAADMSLQEGQCHKSFQCKHHHLHDDAAAVILLQEEVLP